MTPALATTRRDRTTLVLVAALFLGTPLLAGLWYGYGGAARASRTVNHGALVEPPRAVAGAGELGLLDRWTLVVDAHGACAADCAATLLLLRQVRLSLGKDLDRIGRVLVSDGPVADAATLATAHPDLRVLDGNRGAALRTALAGLGTEPGRAFVVDPLGNVMMTYAPGAKPADVQADLKRLLLVSEPWMRR